MRSVSTKHICYISISVVIILLVVTLGPVAMSWRAYHLEQPVRWTIAEWGGVVMEAPSAPPLILRWMGYTGPDRIEYVRIPLHWTDAELQQLAVCRFVRFLDLSASLITDDSLDLILRFRHLEMLDVTGTRITAAGVDRLQRARPGLDIGPLPFELHTIGGGRIIHP